MTNMENGVTIDESGVELGLITDAAARMLAEHWPQGGKRNLASLWQALTAQGLHQIPLTGAAGSLALALAVVRELGRAACPAPYLSTLVARAVVPDGVLPADAAIATAFVGADSGQIRLSGDRLHGHLRHVEHAPDASHLLILDPAQAAACVLALKDATVTVTPALAQATLADIAIDGAPVTAFALSADRIADLDRITRLGMAARAYGGAQRGFDLVVEHARTRRQFGQPIGRFQAVQHKLTSSRILLDGLRLQLDAATAACDAQAADWPYRAATATAFAAQTLRQVALETQHMFGAIGYAEEHEAPSHFRGIHADAIRMGGGRRARAELACLLLDSPVTATAGPEDQAGRAGGLRAEIRNWLDTNWTLAERATNRARPFDQRLWNTDFARRLGRDGWTMLTWPVEAGGRAAAPMEQLAYLEEMQAAGAPYLTTIVGSWILGPEIISHGSPELQNAMLPGIRAGELSFCLGYSEPESGSDLASLKTRAVRDGDDYIVNGQKIWTTNGHEASHMILAARTNPDPDAKHGGISLFVIPMDLPGITVRPSMAFYGHYFCNIFFDDVRIPATSLLGPENGGWRILTNALASERIIMGSFATQLQNLFDAIVAHIRADATLAADPLVRDRIGGLAAELQAATELALRSILLSGGTPGPIVEAAISKVYSSELGERLTETALDLLGPVALLGEDSAGVPCDGQIEQLLRRSIMMVIGGGTNEIQRTLIAQRGLDLPR